MARRSTVIVRDLGYSQIVEDLNAAGEIFITVGIHGEQGERKEGDPATNVLIGSVHEFGSPSRGIPQRSFIRSTMDEERERIGTLTAKAMDRVASGQLSAAQALGAVGQFAQTKIQQKITKLREPPNAPATIAQKGSSNPLIDTGQMRASITHVVHNVGKRPSGGG